MIFTTVMALVLSFGQAVSAETIYTETFSGTPGNLPTEGWAGRLEATDNADVCALPGPIEARTASADGYTYLYSNYTTSCDATAEAVLYTDEFPIDQTAFDISTISWEMRNSNNGASVGCRVVVEVDGNWYVSDETFTNGGSWSTYTFNFDNSAATWADLTFDVDMTGSPSDIAVGGTPTLDLPSETITRFGLYFRTNSLDGYRASRFTNFTIDAEPVPVPEPTAYTLLALALLLIALPRRR